MSARVLDTSYVWVNALAVPWDTIELSFAYPFMVLGPAHCGDTIVVARALCLTQAAADCQLPSILSFGIQSESVLTLDSNKSSLTLFIALQFPISF